MYWCSTEKCFHIMSGRASQRVNLARPLPVMIYYTTAVVRPGGIVAFYGDVYGHDARLERLEDIDRIDELVLVAHAKDDDRQGRLARESPRLVSAAAPAIIIFNWALDDLKSMGWIVVLIYAVCAALRLARFNTNHGLKVAHHQRVRMWAKRAAE